MPKLLFHSHWIHFYISLTKKSLKWKLFVAMRRQWSIAIFLKIWMWWFPAQDWYLWVPVALSFWSLWAEAWLLPPNPFSLRLTGCIYTPLHTFMVCRATKLPAPATFSTSFPNILITAHLTCTSLLILMWVAYSGPYNLASAVNICFRYMDWQDS